MGTVFKADARILEESKTNVSYDWLNFFMCSFMVLNTV